MIIDSLQKENSKDNTRIYKMVNSVNDIINKFLLVYA